MASTQMAAKRRAEENSGIDHSHQARTRILHKADHESLNQFILLSFPQTVLRTVTYECKQSR